MKEEGFDFCQEFILGTGFYSDNFLLKFGNISQKPDFTDFLKDTTNRLDIYLQQYQSCLEVE